MFSMINIPNLEFFSAINVKIDKEYFNKLSIKQRQQLLKYLEHKKINSSK